MKTLSDFKKLPIGTKILTIQGLDRYRGTVREIEHKQTNAIRFKGGSWLEYPKAKDCIFTDHSIIIETKTKDGKVWNVLEYAIYNN